jgi:hypothetical protein
MSIRSQESLAVSSPSCLKPAVLLNGWYLTTNKKITLTVQSLILFLPVKKTQMLNLRKDGTKSVIIHHEFLFV